MVLGGSSGIGLGVVKALLSIGCEDVIISSSNIIKLDTVANELRTVYPSATITTVVCDLSRAESLDENVDQTFRDLQSKATTKINHIVVAAGDNVDHTPLMSRSVGSMVQSGMVRFFAPMVIAKHAPKYMVEGPESSITLTGGIISRSSPSGWTFHAAYFAALEGAARNLALELRPLRVNVVSPGPVLTGAWDNVSENLRKALDAAVLPKCASGKIGTPEEVAEAYLYLMRNPNATGSIVETDGGFSAMAWA